jgi:PEP-CTERM motif
MFRTWAPFALAITVLATPFAAAHAASLLARADGVIWGTPAGDQSMGTGATPVTASGGYQRPPQVNDGRFDATATAAVGSLGAAANLSVSNAPGFLSPQFPFYGESQVSGLASFQDSWIFAGQPLDAPGKLRLTLSFEGATSGSATNGITNPFGRFDFDITSLAEFSNIHQARGYHSGARTAADETVVLDLDFLYGRPLLLSGTLVAVVQVVSLPTSFTYSGVAEAQFGNTAALVGLEVQDALGNYTTDFALETESGGRYPFQPVPEPTTLTLLALGLAGMAWTRSRRAKD